jgi:biopolymer transport protein ExbD
MSAWQVRQLGATDVYQLPQEADVLTALRDGNFVPEDEVKGPTDEAWQPLETHPAFAEAALDIEPPRAEEKDDTQLDMNPLIDVCLVLLIFFILTITYATLERALDVPDDSPEDKGSAKISVDDPNVKDRIFIVTARMELDSSSPTGERPSIKIGVKGSLKDVAPDRIFAEMESLINTTGRREMVMDIDKHVPWGIETAILDAAKGNKVHNIINNQRSAR